MLGEAKAPEEEQTEDSGGEIDVILDEIEASSNIVISDRKAFGEAMTALVECCHGGMYDEDEDEPEHKAPALMIALGGKPKGKQ